MVLMLETTKKHIVLYRIDTVVKKDRIRCFKTPNLRDITRRWIEVRELGSLFNYYIT